MRDTFHRELEALDESIVQMGAMVEQSTEMATRALIENDLALAQQVQDRDVETDALFIDIEKRALAMLAQQAPVAADLRLVVAVLRVSTDLERVGDLAYNVGKLLQMGTTMDARLKSVRSLVCQLGCAASELMGHAIDAWAAKDLELAVDISRQDDKLDDLHSRLIEELTNTRENGLMASALQLAMMARYFERIGDHAVNLAERLRYYITGDEQLLG